MSSTQKNFVAGAALLSISGLICKIIGMFFRIPLSNMIGATGIALYQMAYPAYTMLLTLSTSGLPVAISRLVSERMAHKDEYGAKRVFKISLYILLSVGFVSSILLFAGSDKIASFVGNQDAALSYMAISPALFIVSGISAIRGYMQGRQNMMPTAISQLIEQVFKIIIAFPLAAYGMRSGPVYAAAYALLGITLSELVALFYLIIVYFHTNRSLAVKPVMPQRVSSRSIARQLVSIAIPIALGASIVPLVSLIDTGMITQRLMSIGYSNEVATDMYGLLSGPVISLINVPNAIAVALAMSLVPAIASAKAMKNSRSVRRQASFGIKLAFLFGLPCALGMSFFSSGIMSMLYPAYSPEYIAQSASILEIYSYTIIGFVLVQSTTGILQGMGKHKIPVYTLLAGAAVKAALNYVLIGIPAVNIYGAPISSIACYVVSAIPNTYFIIKYTRMKFDWKTVVIRPALASAIMAAALYVFKLLFTAESRLITLVGVVFGVAVYVLAAIITKAVTPRDLAFVPGGRKLVAAAQKIGIWRKYKAVRK